MHGLCTRALAGVLVALALTSGSGAAQGRSRAEGWAFVTFLTSLAAQRTARTCERGDPGYRQRFDQLYGRWSARHRDGITQGEAAYHALLANKNLSEAELTTLTQIENAMRELAEAPRDTSPITLDDTMRSLCTAILAELEAGLDS
jgi:hypothetical protein